MGLRTTTMMFEAKRDVKYRYACEECNVTTEWFTTDIHAHTRYELNSTRFKINAEYDTVVINKKKKSALKKLKGITDVLDRALNDPTGEYNFPGKHALADLYNGTFAAGGACPSCGGLQSWYPMDTVHLSISKYVKVYMLSILLLGNFVGLLFIIAAAWGYGVLPLLVLAFQLVLLAAGAGIGFLRAVYLIRKRERNRKIPVERHVPDVIWGDPVVVMRDDI